MADIQQYGGKWRIFEDDEWYNGNLYVNEEQRTLTLEITIPSVKGKLRPRLPYIGKVPFVNGVLHNKAEVLLYDCAITYEKTYVYQYSQQIIYPLYGFAGLSIENKEELVFSKVELDFGEIIGWSGLCEYKLMPIEDGHSSLQWESQPAVTFDLRDGVEVSFRPEHELYSTRLPAIKNETVLYQRVYTVLKYQTPTAWEKVIEDILSLQYLIGLGMNRVVGIKSAICYSPVMVEARPWADGDADYQTPIEVLFGDGNKIQTKDGRLDGYIFQLNDCIKYGMLGKWAAVYPKLRPVLDLLFAVKRNDIQVPELVFLTLTQALETYHARFIANNMGDFIRNVDLEFGRVFNGNGNESGWRAFLLGNNFDPDKINQKRPVELRSRLADLIFAHGEFIFLQYWKGNQEEFVEKVKNSRNYYTHYEEKKKNQAFTRDELVFINRHLECLLRYHILTLIGYDKKVARKDLVESMNKINTNYEIFNKPNKVYE